VTLDQDYDGDELAEQEIALFAQDREGVVWELGEYPEEFDAGTFTGAPSTWVARVAGARAGIAMQAHPATGTPEYNQGYAPRINFDDRGRVVRTAAQVSDTFGSYADGIVVDEYSAPEPDDGHQLKFHAPGRGVVRIQAVGGKSQETLQRTAKHTLDGADLDRVNALVLELDKRAYTHAAPVWGATAPASTPARPAPAPSDGPDQCLLAPAGRSSLRTGC
jgi:hypothetical protein